MANKLYTEVLDTMVSWTDEYRDEFEQKIRYGEHTAVCGLAGKVFVMPDPITYPNISSEFAPVDECANRNLPGNGNRPLVNIIACLLAMFAAILTI